MAISDRRRERSDTEARQEEKNLVKIIELISPRHGISLQAFHDHWRHPHGTIAKNVRSVRRYIQNHRIDSSLLGPNPTPFEGVAEGWFDSLAEGVALGAMPYAIEHVFPDEERFIDRSKVKVFFVEEEVIASGPHAGAQRRPQTETSAYDLEWSDNNRPLAIKLLQFIEAGDESSWAADADAELGHRIGALRHVRSRAVSQPSAYLGMRELWWPTLTAFERGMALDPAAWAALRDRPRRSFSLLFQAERLV